MGDNGRPHRGRRDAELLGRIAVHAAETGRGLTDRL
jgi:hypothetical protein